MTSLIALLALASPNCSMSRSGCAAWTAATAARLGIDPVRRLGRVAGDLEVDERGVAVGRDGAVAGQRRLDVLDVRNLRQAARHVLDGGPERRVLDGELVALDEHRPP